MSRSGFLGTAIVILLLAGCASDGAVTTIDESSATDVSVGEELEAPPAEDGATSPEPTAEGNSERAALPDGFDGILELDGEVFLFKLRESGSCVPDLAGMGGFQAILTRVDEAGEPVPWEIDSENGFTQGATFFLLHEETGFEGASNISISTDAEWKADPSNEDGTGVDELLIDGNRAAGTATFVGKNGEGPVSGPFELVCPGG